MADSVKLTALKRLTGIIEATPVTPIAGLTMPSTLSGLVRRGRLRYDSTNDPEVMVSIVEAPRSLGAVFGSGGQTAHEQWGLLISGWCPDHKVNPTDNIYSLLDDVERQLDKIVRTASSSGFPLYSDEFMLGLSINAESPRDFLIQGFTRGPSIVRPPQEGLSSTCFFYLPVTLKLSRVAGG